jgi:hypothetical protein
MKAAFHVGAGFVGYRLRKKKVLDVAVPNVFYVGVSPNGSGLADVIIEIVERPLFDLLPLQLKPLIGKV